MIDMKRIWRAGDFKKLPVASKLLFIYLSTTPDLSEIGILNIDLNIIKLDIGIDDQELRKSCKYLIDHKLIYIFGINGEVFFFLPNHFKTISKSDRNISKCKEEIKKLPIELIEKLESKDLLPDLDQYLIFNAPNIEEVEQFCFSEGYMIDVEKFINYYENQGRIRGKDYWCDSRGKRIRDWKSKLRKVWFKPENELKKYDGAPKGFEYFFVKTENRTIFPDGWKNGKPYSKNFTDDFVLKEEFEKRTK